MEFRLFYRGPLESNGSRKEKQALRRQFHPQLRKLWSQPPLDDHKLWMVDNRGAALDVKVGRQVGKFWCMPLVSEGMGQVAELDVLFLRPQRPGAIISSSGDIDNRMKTLLDALQIPDANQVLVDDAPGEGEDPFYCLLEDDVLVTRLNVTTDQFLLESSGSADVVLVIHVLMKPAGSNPMGFP